MILTLGEYNGSQSDWLAYGGEMKLSAAQRQRGLEKGLLQKEVQEYPPGSFWGSGRVVLVPTPASEALGLRYVELPPEPGDWPGEPRRWGIRVTLRMEEEGWQPLDDAEVRRRQAAVLAALAD